MLLLVVVVLPLSAIIPTRKSMGIGRKRKEESTAKWELWRGTKEKNNEKDRRIGGKTR